MTVPAWTKTHQKFHTAMKNDSLDLYEVFLGEDRNKNSEEIFNVKMSRILDEKS
jgi:hypothetical protein